jgi:signal transduction histidine kinase/CheY-like chemotaxis protein
VSGLDTSHRDSRVLVLAPTGRDAEATGLLLTKEGIAHTNCPSFQALVEGLGDGAAAVLLPEEALTANHRRILVDALSAQPAWSDLPLLVLTRKGAESEGTGESLRPLGNVTLLERPLRVGTLLSAIRTALRARGRQYEIREHIAERERAEQALRAADRRKDEFLATLGHELRNPLAPLRTGLQLLESANVQDPLVRRVSAVLERQVGHLVRLVDDLLEVSRITRGLIEVRRETLDLLAVLRSAIDTSRPAVDTAGHELTVEFPPQPILIEGDPMRLTQVFANLLANAAKYTDQGGHIWLTAKEERDRVLVSVRDNGIGIPPSQLASVFDMFTQVDRSSRRAQGGLGIGLTLVRSLVALHGGTVQAWSDGPGTGSEFTVELPLFLGREATNRDAETRLTLPSRRILVVDDNQDAGDMLAALLTTCGATVSTVRDGRSALDALDAFRPDAIVMDIGMPGMDGYEVARRIRATPAHNEVLLIALTGWGQEHDQHRARAAGFDHHLLKPLDVSKLREVLA